LGTEPGDEGKVIYVITDGGTTAPPDGVIRNAALLRAELNPRAQGRDISGQIDTAIHEERTTP
jgi:hypothetical protein